MRYLKIFLHSFEFNNILLNDSDQIQVNVTTFPEGFHQSFYIRAFQTKNTDISLIVGIIKEIKEIHFVFIQKNNEKENIIASTIIHYTQMPLSSRDLKNSQPQIVNIYEPTHYISSKNNTIYGKMKIRLKLRNKIKKEKKEKYLINDENTNHNILLCNGYTYN